jgi:DNA-binding response OmpR family regulator
MNYSEHSIHTSAYSGCVLVIDDNDQVRQMLSLALETAGFDVIEAGTQFEGHDQLAHSRPDALVLDLQRCAADGLEVLASIRARHDLRAMPILFLAGCENDEFRWQALRAGADWFGLRPLGMIELQKKVAALILNGRPRLKAIAGHNRRRATLGRRLRPAG